MSLYAKMQGLAGKILSNPQFKQDGIVFIRVTKTTPDGPDPGAIVYDPFPLNGVAKGASKKFIDQGLAIAGDYESVHAVSDFNEVGREPVPGDIVEMNGIRYTIKQALKTPPTGTAIVIRLIYGNS